VRTRLRAIRNFSFLVLAAVVVWAAALRAWPIINGPFCDDPEGGWVAWAAEGTCANDYESDCAEACFECYSHYPKAIEQGQCNNGTGVYGADCGCHIVK
jgi:hypothetical protein